MEIVITGLVFVGVFSAAFALGILTEDRPPKWVQALGAVASTSLVVAALIFAASGLVR